MLRANKLKVINPEINSSTCFDEWISNFGGCTYTNCYTPSPDTPRSLACLYTGLYPKNNGCKTRIEWPAFYLKPEINTIFKYLNEDNFNTFTTFTKAEIKTGILSKEDLRRVTNYNSIFDLYKSDVIKQNSDNALFFLNLQDYHHSVTDYYALPKAVIKGNRRLINTFDLLFNRYHKDFFDYIFIFSDHGCFLVDDERDNGKPYQLLRDNRSKIFMHIRKKGENNHTKDSSLTSILDIYPTLLNILNKSIDPSIDGISFFKSKKDRFIVMEDSSVFKPRLGLYNDIWRYKDNQVSLYLDLENTLLEYNDKTKHMNSSINSSKLSTIMHRIEDISASYSEIKAQKDILKSYSKIDNSDRLSIFSDGSPRNSLKFSIFYRFASKFLSLFFFIFYKFKNNKVYNFFRRK